MQLTETIWNHPMSRFQRPVVAICIVLTMIDGLDHEADEAAILAQARV